MIAGDEWNTVVLKAAGKQKMTSAVQRPWPAHSIPNSFTSFAHLLSTSVLVLASMTTSSGQGRVKPASPLAGGVDAHFRTTVWRARGVVEGIDRAERELNVGFGIDVIQ